MLIRCTAASFSFAKFGCDSGQSYASARSVTRGRVGRAFAKLSNGQRCRGAVGGGGWGWGRMGTKKNH